MKQIGYWFMVWFVASYGLVLHASYHEISSNESAISTSTSSDATTDPYVPQKIGPNKKVKFAPTVLVKYYKEKELPQTDDTAHAQTHQADEFVAQQQKENKAQQNSELVEEHQELVDTKQLWGDYVNHRGSSTKGRKFSKKAATQDSAGEASSEYSPEDVASEYSSGTVTPKDSFSDRSSQRSPENLESLEDVDSFGDAAFEYSPVMSSAKGVVLDVASEYSHGNSVAKKFLGDISAEDIASVRDKGKPSLTLHELAPMYVTDHEIGEVVHVDGKDLSRIWAAPDGHTYHIRADQFDPVTHQLHEERRQYLKRRYQMRLLNAPAQKSPARE